MLCSVEHCKPLLNVQYRLFYFSFCAVGFIYFNLFVNNYLLYLHGCNLLLTFVTTNRDNNT